MSEKKLITFKQLTNICFGAEGIQTESQLREYFDKLSACTAIINAASTMLEHMDEFGYSESERAALEKELEDLNG